MERTFYDDALPQFAKLVKNALGEQSLDSNIFLRDAVGRLTFVCLESFSDKQKKGLAIDAFAHLQPYVDSIEYAVATPADLFDPSLNELERASVERIEHPDFSGYVRLVERRILGQDWMSAPGEPIAVSPPIFVFASLKGGVGRSTALAVTAADLAADGQDVLVIDLDLEAPGIGTMLLPSDAIPRYGTLDFYVENSLSGLDGDFFEQSVGVSPLTRGRGLVHVVPAIGQSSLRYPANALGKLSRAYLEDSTADSGPKTFLAQTRDLIAVLASRRDYHTILVDARAGLNETTAASLQGLAAEILLFGVDTTQTFDAFRFLLAHLSRFRPPVPTEDDWRLRLRMVHAKATVDPESLARFRDRSFELFADYIYDEASPTDESSVNFDLDDASAPHYAWPIVSDTNYFEFDPLKRSEQLLPDLFRGTFGNFTRALRDRLRLIAGDEC